MKEYLKKYIERLKSSLSEFFYFLGFIKVSIQEMFLFASRKEVSLVVLIRQILFTGFESLKLITLLGLAIGAIIIIQGISLLQNFGQSDLIYTILVIIITKELGPVITAFIIISRSGTAISTELGNMVVNHEVEALSAVGINPIGYLVVPRIFGVVISLFALNLYLNVSGLIGGYIVASFVTPLSFVDFITKLSTKMKVMDVIMGQIKTIVFGFSIGIISCYNGLSVNYASTEVPQRTIKSVVTSLSWVIIFDVMLAFFTYSI